MTEEEIKQDRLRGQVLNLCHVDHGLSELEIKQIDIFFEWKGNYTKWQEGRIDELYLKHC
jgi:hypothetical protein